MISLSTISNWTLDRHCCKHNPYTYWITNEMRMDKEKSWCLSRGHIFSHAGNELGASSFLAGNKFLNDFPLHLMPGNELVSRLTKKYGLRSSPVFLKLSGFKSRLRTLNWVAVPVNQELFIFCPKYVCFLFIVATYWTNCLRLTYK